MGSLSKLAQQKTNKPLLNNTMDSEKPMENMYCNEESLETKDINLNMYCNEKSLETKDINLNTSMAASEKLVENLSSKKKSLSSKAVLQGAVLVLISNLIYIGNNYLVAWTQLQAPEVTLVRGTFQMLLFSAIIWRSKKS